jgi:hypothetical protein
MVKNEQQEGIDENLLLDTIQLHREDADLTPEQFRHSHSASFTSYALIKRSSSGRLM